MPGTQHSHEDTTSGYQRLDALAQTELPDSLQDFGGSDDAAPGGMSRPDVTAEALPDLSQGRHYRPARLRTSGEAVNDGLAWFSLALGVTQIMAPDALTRLIGVRPSRQSRAAMQAIGVRELASGLGLMKSRKRTPWLWSRVAGDVMDISLLGVGAGRRSDDRVRATRAMFAVGGVAALDLYAAARSQRALKQQAAADGFASQEETVSGPLAYERAEARGAGTETSPDNAQLGVVTPDAITATQAGLRKVRHAVTINRPASELYEYWRDFENLPSFMTHLDSVTDLGGGRSHWVTRAPGGAKVEWDAETVADIPNELIAWQSLPDADVKNAGTVRFIPVPAGRGTEVHVEMDYDPPAGALGTVVAKLFRAEPSQQVRDDLRAFKQVMEAGEILVSNSISNTKIERVDSSWQRKDTPSRTAEVR
ncbi:MAG TPA: SRPBCC family protein [Gemmatimonadaceae bacterium]|nr:SRPBCC family protein [Gemmatimonadaceae bacterium]